MKFCAVFLTCIFATLIGPLVGFSSAQERILVTRVNQHLFLFLGGKLDLACHRPPGASQTLYGEMERVENPDGTFTRTFVVRTETQIKKLQSKYALQIKNLLKQLKEARGRDARRAVINSIRQKIKARQALYKEVRSAVNGCGTFAPGSSAEPRPQDPNDFDSDPDDEELIFEDSPFPALATNVDGSVRLEPNSEGLVFYVSCLGNDANHGLNPDNKVRTIARAFSLLQQASGNGFTDHQIRLERGCVYDEPLPMISGRNRETPFVYGPFGSMTESPPRVGAVVIDGSYRNIALTGLDFSNPARDPESPSFNPSSPDRVAVTIRGAVKRILVQQSTFRGYAVGIHIEGRSSRVPELATRVASIANTFVDLYNLNGGLGGRSNGIYAINVRGLNVTNSNFFRIGNPRILSAEQGNTGGTLPVVTPNDKAIGVRVDGIADSYFVVRGSQFVQGYSGIKVNGYTTDEFGQLSGTLSEARLNDNIFYEMTHGIYTDVPAVYAFNNAIVRGIRRGGSPNLSGIHIHNASVIDLYENAWMKTLSPIGNRDVALLVDGIVNYAYHKVTGNKVHHWPGGFVIGNLTWYDGIVVRSLLGSTEWVPLSHAPRSIIFANNYISNIDSTFPLIEMKQWDRGISAVLFRNNTLWNPALNDAFWSAQESGRITGIEHVYAPLPSYCDSFFLGMCGLNPSNSNLCGSCQPACLYTIVSRTPNLRMQNDWYATAGAVLVQGNAVHPIIGSSSNTVTLECTFNLAVGQNHSIEMYMTQNRWYQYINRGGGQVNELPPSDPEGLNIGPIEYQAPDRDLLTFMAMNTIQLRGANGFRPAATVDDYINYIANFWQHSPNEDTSIDPRTAGRNVANFHRVGLNIVQP